MRNVRGIMAIEDLAARIQGGDDHTPRTALLCLENTHNAGGGTVLPVEYMASVSALASHVAATSSDVPAAGSTA